MYVYMFESKLFIIQGRRAPLQIGCYTRSRKVSEGESKAPNNLNHNFALQPERKIERTRTFKQEEIDFCRMTKAPFKDDIKSFKVKCAIFNQQLHIHHFYVVKWLVLIERLFK